MTGADEARIALEHDGSTVAVGDWVAIGAGPTGDRIAGVLPRRHVFSRAADAKGRAAQVVAANLDTILVCDALDGRLSLRHLQRYLAMARESGATPVVLVTKSDAVSSEAVAEAVDAINAVADGARVVVVSSATGEGMDALAPYLVSGHTLALLGLSGVGKSTLVNLLAGADVLTTGAVRSDGSGRHTTTHRQLVPLPGGAMLIDTPGMRSLSPVVGEGRAPRP